MLNHHAHATVTGLPESHFRILSPTPSSIEFADVYRIWRHIHSGVTSLSSLELMDTETLKTIVASGSGVWNLKDRSALVDAARSAVVSEPTLLLPDITESMGEGLRMTGCLDYLAHPLSHCARLREGFPINRTQPLQCCRLVRHALLASLKIIVMLRTSHLRPSSRVRRTACRLR